jgi:hypothetical protein
MENFMRRYSFWITSALGACALIWLIADWNGMPVVQRLPVMYIVALSVHEIEELKLPGGFVELVTAMTGVEIKNIGLAKFGLLLFTLYATVVPAFLAGYVWPVMATLFIGCIEVFAHLAAAGVNPGRFYSPGMITALCVQFPVAVYGYWQLFRKRTGQGNILALGGDFPAGSALRPAGAHRALQRAEMVGVREKRRPRHADQGGAPGDQTPAERRLSSVSGAGRGIAPELGQDALGQQASG